MNKNSKTKVKMQDGRKGYVDGYIVNRDNIIMAIVVLKNKIVSVRLAFLDIINE